MPFISINATHGFTLDQKKALVQQTSDAVVEALAAPVTSVRVMLHELPEGLYMAAGQWEERAINFRVELIAGRTDEKKAALIAALTKVAQQTTGTPVENVRSWLIELPSTNMGAAGGVTAASQGR